jgi:DNA-binding response OmpR family regulator
MDYALKLVTTVSKNMKVLYVEDNKEAQEQTIKMLKNFFSDITVANDGQEGLDKFKQGSYHIVFTDIEMPIMNGIIMIDKIREIDKNIPIVIFSAYDKSEYFLKTISAGIDGYILKPYDLREIIDVIKKIIMKFDIEVKLKNKISLVDGFFWDKEKKELIKNNESIKLTKNEIKLFELLSSSKQRIVSNEDIEYYIFEDEIIDNKRVRNLISRLKSKLKTTLVESNYANGYKLKTSETI